MAELLAGRRSDFENGSRTFVGTENGEIVVFRHGDRFYAFDNTCVHMGGPVGEGDILGKVEAVLGDDRELITERFSETEIHLVCPWHGWEYDIETGVAAGDPKLCLKKYEVETRGDDVYVIR